jgi:hypothetical protein
MDERRYAGQHVLVSALLFHTPHGRVLYSADCSSDADLDSSSDTWDRNAKHVIDAALADNPLARIPVVVMGIFQPQVGYHGDPHTIRAYRAVLEDAKIVAARQP